MEGEERAVAGMATGEGRSGAVIWGVDVPPWRSASMTPAERPRYLGRVTFGACLPKAPTQFEALGLSSGFPFQLSSGSSAATTTSPPSREPGQLHVVSPLGVESPRLLVVPFGRDGDVWSRSAPAAHRWPRRRGKMRVDDHPVMPPRDAGEDLFRAERQAVGRQPPCAACPNSFDFMELSSRIGVSFLDFQPIRH